MKLKKELDDQFQKWQEKIESRDVNLTDVSIASYDRYQLERKIDKHYHALGEFK